MCLLGCKETKCVWDKFIGSIASGKKKKNHIANLNLEEGEEEEVKWEQEEEEE